MRYEVGDYIKIKTWGKMKEEFGLDSRDDIKTTKSFSEFAPETGHILCSPTMTAKMEEYLNKDFKDRILQIREIKEQGHYLLDGLYLERMICDGYHMKMDNKYLWGEEVIEGVIKNYKPPEPIKTRFEILDI